MGLKILITGATGFIGHRLSAALLARGDALHAVIRPQSDRSRLIGDVKPLLYDGNAEAFCDAVGEIAPAIVFHLAARFQDRHAAGDIDGLIRDNVTFGTVLAEAMTRAGAHHLVNTGTSWQHYRNAAYSPTCLYATTKQALEDILAYYSETRGLRIVTLKLFDTYGPDDRRGKLLSRFAAMARDGSHLDMSPGEQLIDLVHVDDVIAAFLAAAERLLAGLVDTPESYAVSSGNPVRLRELATIFADCAGAPLDIAWGARPYREREVMVPWSAGAPLPGWRPQIGLREGLRELLESDV